MKEEDKSKLIEVFKGSLWEAQLVKSLLGNNDIESTLKDGMVVNVVLPDTAIDVAVLVNEANYETAMEVVRAYEKGRGRLNLLHRKEHKYGATTNENCCQDRQQCIDTS